MSAQQEIKIELVTEAIEALVLATVVATTNYSTPHANAINHQLVFDAREVVRKALRELLTPTLRVISPEPPALKMASSEALQPA